MDIGQIDPFNLLIKNGQIDLEPIQVHAYQEKRSMCAFMAENVGTKHLKKSFNSFLLDFFFFFCLETSGIDKNIWVYTDTQGVGEERKKEKHVLLSL